MKILVTGAAGFIGTHLCDELRSNGHWVTKVDRKITEAHELRVEKNISTIMKWRPDIVVHLAAQVGRLFGEDDLRWTVEDNAAVTALVAKACGDRDVRLVYASTSEVYGDQGEAMCYEDGPLALPHNLYGLSKRWGEDVCRLYAPHGLTIWRISMPYGPGLPAGRGRAAICNFLHQADNGLQIPVHRDSERSWCWIGDTVRAMRMTIEDAESGVFNVGRDDAAVPMHTVAEIACELTGGDPANIVEIDPPTRQTVVKRLGTDKIRALGWEPEVDLREGMSITLEWLRSHDSTNGESAYA